MIDGQFSRQASGMIGKDRFYSHMILYRPVGLQELELIYDSGMKAFPARLPKQPIFYPVLDLEYARQTAAGWNAKSGASAGYVTQFKVEDSYIARFEEHTVGKSQHQEFWIQAEEVEEFNKHIVGHIKVVEAHFGKAFQGFIPEAFALQGKNAVEQFTLLANTYIYKRMDFYLEIKRNHKAVFLNYPFWQAHEFKNPGLKEKIVRAIKEAWLTSFPQIPLPLPPPIPGETSLAGQTESPSSVDPIRQATTPRKQMGMRSSAPAKQTDLPSFARPVHQEITPAKKTSAPPPVQHLVNPPDEDTALIDQTGSHSVTNPVYEEISRLEESDSRSSVDLFDEDDSSIGKRTSEFFEDSLDENLALEEDDSPSGEDSDDEETEPVTPSGSHSWGSSVHEDLTFEDETDPADPEDSDEKDILPVQAADPPLLARPFREPIAPVKQTGSHFAQGIELGLSGKYDEAMAELSRAVDEDSDHIVAYTSLGVAFHRLGEDDRALSCYEAALQIDPTYAEAHYFRANLLYSRGNVREAIAGYRTALGLNPDLVGAHQQPVPRDRLTDYSPSPAEMHRIAKPAHRILELNQLLERNPGQPNLFKARAAEYSRLWNYEQAIADYSSSLAIQPDDAEALYSRGLCYEQMRQLERAREDYRRANTLDPQLSEAYIQRGVAFGNAGNFRQSVASLTEGIRLAPRNADAYFNRGTSYFQLGDLENAVEDFSSVIRLSPGDEAAYYWRGISHEEAGRQREAIADYKQFLALSQDKNARREIERRLSQWKEVDPNAERERRPIPKEEQKANQVQPGKPGPALDLYDLLVALGGQALRATWYADGVDCYGEMAEELHALTDQNRPVGGDDLLRITAGIRQTIEGDFQAFDPGAASPWIFIRAWQGSGFYVETDDPHIEKELKRRFPTTEEVEDAAPPYRALFIRI